MDKELFCIYDKLAEIYEPPFVEINRLTAIRRIEDLVIKNPSTLYATSSVNYELVKIGTYDETGAIILPHPPELILKFGDITKKDN